MKPKVLTDILANFHHELTADNKEKTIGRSPDCDIIVPPSQPGITYDSSVYNLASKVSREHALIKQDKSGCVFLTPKSRKSPTFIGTKENPYEEQIYETVQIFPGQYITLGKGYRFLLEPAKDNVAEKNYKDKFRRRDTDEIVLPTSLLG